MLKSLLAAVSLLPALAVHAAVVFPSGPNTFNTNAAYDTNFKESVFSSGNTRNAGGYVQLQGFQYGPAVYDRSATGGSNGSGGTGGNDADSEFSDFTISADIATTEVGQFGMGFLMRLNSEEGNGYFASFVPESQTSIIFAMSQNAGLNEGIGGSIFSISVPLVGLTFNTNTFDRLKVTAKDSTFDFDFGSGAATASFTDPAPIATIGQVGFVLLTASPTSATRMDNFTIVPEPTAGSLLLVTLAGVFAGELRRQSRLSLARRLV